MGRYDYSDPGQDPAYCDGLTAPDDDDLPFHPQPKPTPRVRERQARTRAREEQARIFRAKVWARDKGRCVVCKRVVRRTLGLDPLRGEVHHRRGRNVAPEDRYNVARAVLLCLGCHVDVTRHRITLPEVITP